MITAAILTHAMLSVASRRNIRAALAEHSHISIQQRSMTFLDQQNKEDHIMKAELHLTGNETINSAHRKDDHFSREIAAFVLLPNNIIKNAVCMRFYETKSRTYACLWGWGHDKYPAGSAWADGGGYHLGSAAAHDAFKDAHVELSESLDGRGYEAVCEGVKALAKALFPEALLVYVHTAHP
jgi:hypothetical protein